MWSQLIREVDYWEWSLLSKCLKLNCSEIFFHSQFSKTQILCYYKRIIISEIILIFLKKVKANESFYRQLWFCFSQCPFCLPFFRRKLFVDESPPFLFLLFVFQRSDVILNLESETNYPGMNFLIEDNVIDSRLLLTKWAFPFRLHIIFKRSLLSAFDFVECRSILTAFHLTWLSHYFFGQGAFQFFFLF